MKRNHSEPAAENSSGRNRSSVTSSGRIPGNSGPIYMLVGMYLIYLGWGILKNKLDNNTSMSMAMTILSAVLMALAGVGVIVYAGVIWKRAADDAQAKAEAAAAEEAEAAAQEAEEPSADMTDPAAAEPSEASDQPSEEALPCSTGESTDECEAASGPED